jgi:outer membrane immunogenic protein
MIRHIAAGLGAFFLTATASPAADLPLKAPPAPLPSWAGSYGGISGGWATGHSDQTDNGLPAPAPPANNDGHYNVSGGFIGATLGYNWQSGPVVFGLEGDISYANIYGSSQVCGAPIFANHCSTLMDAFGTLRGRLGVALGANGWVLPYVTAGAAVGHLRGFDSFVGAEGSAFRPGWTAGVGVEAKFAPHWSAKLEYLHIDLGAAPVFEVVAKIPETVSFRADLIRAGINYAFNDPAPAPARMYAKAPAIAPVLNWTGFYAGADLGGAVLGGNGQSNFFQPDPDPLFANLRQNQPANGTSFLAAVHAGFNWQFAKYLVAGIEADGQWQKPRYAFCRENDIRSVACFDNSFGYSYVNSETRSIATVRGRLGVAFDRWMIYGTGGAAFTTVDTVLATNCAIAGCANSGGANFTVTKYSSSLTGWVAGGGVEWMLANNWLARAEYLHADFGTVTNTLLLNPITQCAPAGACGLSWSRQVREDILRFGLSYKFAPWSPVVAKY